MKGALHEHNGVPALTGPVSIFDSPFSVLDCFFLIDLGFLGDALAAELEADFADDAGADLTSALDVKSDALLTALLLALLFCFTHSAYVAITCLFVFSSNTS